MLHSIKFAGALCFAELGCLVPKSGAEYAYLLEAFAKKGKFGALPAFVCSFVYVMILRPAEIAVILLTFAEYSIQPFHSLLALDNLNEDEKNYILKIVAFLALGKHINFYFINDLHNNCVTFCFRNYNVHQSHECEIVR